LSSAEVKIQFWVLNIFLKSISEKKVNTVKPAHEVTSIKQLPLLKDHLFLVTSLKTSYELNLF